MVVSVSAPVRGSSVSRTRPSAASTRSTSTASPVGACSLKDAVDGCRRPVSASNLCAGVAGTRGVVSGEWGAVGGERDAPGHAVARAGDQPEELGAGQDEVEDLREEEEEEGLRIMCLDAHDGERHARHVAERVAGENTRGVPAGGTLSIYVCQERREGREARTSCGRGTLRRRLRAEA